MYIENGIAYAGNKKPLLTVSGVRPLNDYYLWVRFNTGEEKIVDCKPLFARPVFEPLKKIDVFSGVYLDYGCTVWQNGEIDVAPEYLYENGVDALGGGERA